MELLRYLFFALTAELLFIGITKVNINSKEFWLICVPIVIVEMQFI